MQFATLTYLNLPTSYFTQELPTRYVDRLKLLGDTLRDVGFDAPQSVEGAYYLFVRYDNVLALRGKSPTDAAMYMIQTVGVGCVPGDNFYGTQGLGDEYLRFAACRSLSDVQEACRRIRQVLGSSNDEYGISRVSYDAASLAQDEGANVCTMTRSKEGVEALRSA